MVTLASLCIAPARAIKFVAWGFGVSELVCVGVGGCVEEDDPAPGGEQQEREAAQETPEDRGFFVPGNGLGEGSSIGDGQRGCRRDPLVGIGHQRTHLREGHRFGCEVERLCKIRRDVLTI